MKNENSLVCSEPRPIHIKTEHLSTEVLRSILEEYILREGTDYGACDFSLEAKVNQLLKQVLNSDVFIIFDTQTESVNLVTKTEFNNLIFE